MSLRKYHSVEESNRQAQWLITGDPAIPRKVRYLWGLSELLLRPVGTCIPRGVRKYRSIEEANSDRSAWEQERVKRLRTERKIRSNP